MIRITDLRLPLDHPPEALRGAILARLDLAPERLRNFAIARRAHDARKRHAITLAYTIDAEITDEAGYRAAHPQALPTPDTRWRPPARARADSPRPIVIGTGPCGLFAGLALAELGFRPLILDRGPPVRQRTKDTWALWRRGILTPESNVQFGEGGAGTFSDGKLYSQIKDRLHHGRKVLEDLAAAGAPPEILWVAKPHIGTFRLVQVVESLRERIEALGGSYRFNTRVERLTLDPATRAVTGLTTATGEHIPASHIILAIGHSARDTFAALHEQGIAMEAKPLSIGIRIEHPQSLIDRARFGPQAGHPTLGAADYKLVHHASNGRSVYSFCMCPGGTVVAATSEPGRLVTNGMSQYSRAERNANAGLVVALTPADFPSASPLAGIEFQRHWEEQAFVAGGGTYAAPAQRVADFLARRPSTTLGTVTPSYKPGVTPTSLDACLPPYAADALREALPAFGKQIPGFDHPDAVMTGVETRTSSPLRITRNTEFVSLNTPGLYPAGEGAGYAGGILSAAVDGLRVAEALACAAVGVELPPERRWRGGETQGWG